MTFKRAEVLLGNGTYYHWEYNMRMTVARKDLLGMLRCGVEIQQQTNIWSVTSAMHAWGVLQDFYNRSTLRNRVTITRRLHAFIKESGDTRKIRSGYSESYHSWKAVIKGSDVPTTEYGGTAIEWVYFEVFNDMWVLVWIVRLGN
ncbi:unnamed protein product [Peronospora belbahrii]|uniref:Polyprotein n=1 Tax=Peronospora belbahrii TaxID=622444 RepID=A0AAU9KLW5_9STRA|nr:unnamed protein product [Peronospora belbahrii]